MNEKIALQKIKNLKALQDQVKSCKDPIKSIELQKQLITLTLDTLKDPEVKKLMALKNSNQKV